MIHTVVVFVQALVLKTEREVDPINVLSHRLSFCHDFSMLGLIPLDLYNSHSDFINGMPDAHQKVEVLCRQLVLYDRHRSVRKFG
jgi:hypothetical protein